MSERIYTGPLDRVRAIESDALDLDEEVFTYGVNADDRQAYAEYINFLESEHPYIGEAVIVRGEPLGWSFDSDEEIAHLLTFPGDGGKADRVNETKGIYLGYAVKYVYDSEQNTYSQRLVHVLQVGHVSYENEYHNFIIQHNREHFTFAESDVVREQPIDVHSFKDLAKDSAVTQIDRAVFNDTGEGDALQIIQKLGIVASRIFRKNEWGDFASDRARQHVSYINSLGLLDGINVLTEDMVVTTVESPFDPKQTNYYRLDGELVISGGIFDVGPGYQWLSTGELLPGGTPELYVKVKSDADHMVYTPVRRITRVLEQN